MSFAIPAIVIEGIETAAEIAEAVGGMSAAAQPVPQPGKSHPLAVTVFNQTQFPLVFHDLYFDSGRCGTPGPTNVAPFRSMTFSVCEADTSFMTGVSGGVEFTIAVPNAAQKFSAGFSNPYIGSYKASVLPNADAEAAYEAIVETTTSAHLGPLNGRDRHGKPVRFGFLLVAQPGPQVNVTVTQQVRDA